MIIDGESIAQNYITHLKRDSDALKKKGIVPGFGILLVGDDPASHLYVSMKLVLARKLGFYCRRVLLASSASEKEILQKLNQLQEDQRIHGVIIQLPLPQHILFKNVSKAIDRRKDIDCLNPNNLKLLKKGSKPVFLPPTAESVTELIDSTGTKLKNKKIVLVGRGFFAHQIAALCIAKGARVSLISSSGIHSSRAIRQADIVVSAVGKARIVKGDYVKKGVVVIDVGTSKQGGKTVGDVDMQSVMPKARAVSPVPGGVGPVTVSMLMKNVVRAAKALTK